MSGRERVYVTADSDSVVYHRHRDCDQLTDTTTLHPRQLSEVDDDLRACDGCRYHDVPTLGD